MHLIQTVSVDPQRRVRLKFGAARRAAPTFGFSIRGDLLHSRVNLFHSAAVGILFEGFSWER